MSNYYEELGVAEAATSAQIRKAYLDRAMELHPDKTGDDPVKTEAYRRVVAAYAVLSDPEQRARYDSLRPERIAEAAHVVIEKVAHAGLDAACDGLASEAAKRFPGKPKIASAAKHLADLGKELGRDAILGFIRRPK